MLDKNVSRTFLEQILATLSFSIIYDRELCEAIKVAMELFFEKAREDVANGTISEVLPSQFIEMVWELYGKVGNDIRLQMVETGSYTLPQFAYQYGRDYKE